MGLSGHHASSSGYPVRDTVLRAMESSRKLQKAPESFGYTLPRTQADKLGRQEL